MDNIKIEILKKYEKGGNIVLSTSQNDFVTSRVISVIQVDEFLYFTSVKEDISIKNFQILNNKNIALCDHARQMTGEAEILGLISEPKFIKILKIYKNTLPDSYEMFGKHDCYLIRIDIKTFKDFMFIDGAPVFRNLEF